MQARRIQSLNAAREARAFATELPPATCETRLIALTWIETGEQAAVEWPLPAGNVVFGWVSSDGFMISPAREHERLSLDLAWGGWTAQEDLTFIAVDLLSLKSFRPLLLLLPVVALIAYLGFSLLAGQLLLSVPATIALVVVAGALVAAVIAVDERRSRAAHRQLQRLLLETLEAVEIERSVLPAAAQALPAAPERPLPARPVAWRR